MPAPKTPKSSTTLPRLTRQQVFTINAVRLNQKRKEWEALVKDANQPNPPPETPDEEDAPTPPDEEVPDETRKHEYKTSELDEIAASLLPREHPPPNHAPDSTANKSKRRWRRK